MLSSPKRPNKFIVEYEAGGKLLNRTVHGDGVRFGSGSSKHSKKLEVLDTDGDAIFAVEVGVDKTMTYKAPSMVTEE